MTLTYSSSIDSPRFTQGIVNTGPKYSAFLLFIQNIIYIVKIVEYLLSINSTRARESGLKLATLKLPNDASETLNKMFAQDQKWKNIWE